MPDNCRKTPQPPTTDRTKKACRERHCRHTQCRRRYTNGRPPKDLYTVLARTGHDTHPDTQAGRRYYQAMQDTPPPPRRWTKVSKDTADELCTDAAS